jgi:hypothetical protein
MEGRALRSEGNGPVPWNSLQTELVERTPEKTAIGESSTQEVLKLFISVPSLLQAHPSVNRVAGVSGWPVVRVSGRFFCGKRLSAANAATL